MQNEQFIYEYLKAKGLSPAAIAGIMGNIETETAGTWDPAIVNPKENAIGIAQWELGRRTNLQAFAQHMGTSESDLQTQLDFLVQEAQGSYPTAWSEIASTGDPAQAAAYWDADYEHSSGDARQARMSNAKAIYASIQQGQPLSNGPSSNTQYGPNNPDPNAPYPAGTLHPPLSPEQKLAIGKYLKSNGLMDSDIAKATQGKTGNDYDAALIHLYELYVHGGSYNSKPKIVRGGPSLSALAPWADGLAHVLSWLGKVESWKRIGLFALGAIILLVVSQKLLSDSGIEPKVIPV